MPDDPFAELSSFPTLMTERLVLRQVTLDDAEWFLEHFSRPEIVEGQGRTPPPDIEAAREQLTRNFVESFAQRRGMRWGLVLNEPRAAGGAERERDAVPGARAPLIGSAGFYDWNADVRSAEFGYDLRPEYWGRGLMAEALTAILDFAFTSLGLNRAQIILMPCNGHSRRLAKRLGFSEEGVLREHDVDERGDLCDDVVFSLLHREWRGRDG